MKIGAHVSIAGGMENAPLNAKKEGAECFQMFTRSPRGGWSPVITKETIQRFRENCEATGTGPAYVHAPYYVNLASGNNRIRFGSVKAIREELERSSLLGVKAMMTHIGSSKDLGEEAAITQVIAGLKKALTGYTGSTQFLVEISAGSGNIIGDTFEEIRAILDGIGDERVGVCFDTCHAFVSGYDLRTPAAVKETFKKFDKIIGLDRLAVIHVNDAKTEFNSRRDRHEHIGHGTIGAAGIKALVNLPALRSIDLILETEDDTRKADIRLLKSFRDKQ